MAYVRDAASCPGPRVVRNQACLAHYSDTVVMPIRGRPPLVTGVTGLVVSA